MWILRYSLSLLRTVDRAIDAHRPESPAQAPSCAPGAERECRRDACPGALPADATAETGSRAGRPKMPVTEAATVPEGQPAYRNSDARRER